MSYVRREAAAIEKVPLPVTRASLADDFRALGLRAGMTVLVHSSLSALGWVCGGPVAVIQALQDVLTLSGTLVMPTHSSDYSDPAEWRNPPVPPDWVPVVRGEMPLFDPQRTPTRGMGRIPELFRTWPDVRRSRHPQLSFAAWGREAEFVTAVHSLSYALGEQSPLARIYELDGFVLLLGVGYDSNTSMHLAEYRAPNPPQQPNGCPWLEEGRRVWKRFDDIEFNDDVFPEIGAAFEQSRPVSTGKVGAATCRLMRQRALVDFTRDRVAEYRACGPR